MGSNTGRPSLYSDELAEKIVGLIAEGYSERQIEKMDGMPTRRTMLRWKDERPEFCRRSARAREASADVFNDQRMDEVEWLRKQIRKAAETGESIPKGVVEGSRAVMQELAREAAMRDDSRFGDRKRVALESSEPVGAGMAAFYAKLKEELLDQEEQERGAGVA